MKTIIITETKFKQDQEKIKNILINYAFKKINKTTYIGNLDKEETSTIKEELKSNIKEKDNIILIPLCKTCYEKITQYGHEKLLDEEKYVIL